MKSNNSTRKVKLFDFIMFLFLGLAGVILISVAGANLIFGFSRGLDDAVFLGVGLLFVVMAMGRYVGGST